MTTGPIGAHLNGSIAAIGTEEAMSMAALALSGHLRRLPDGETGDRYNWIGWQMTRFLNTPGIIAGPTTPGDDIYGGRPTVTFAPDADPATVFEGFNPGYADAYIESYNTFRSLRDAGLVPADTRFQVQYPTPIAGLAWFVPEDIMRALPGYHFAILADLERLLATLPWQDVAVQWDVAVEIGQMTGAFGDYQPSVEQVAGSLADLLDSVPLPVPVGLHLCYGDFRHAHFKQPESLELQVSLMNQINARAHRAPGWFSVTVPQGEVRPEFFRPLSALRLHPRTEVYFGIVPYHPDGDGTLALVADQIDLINEYAGSFKREGAEWGVSTECGMGRCQMDEVPNLLELHAAIARPL